MAMSELGAYFQRHREDQGLSLEEIEARTRIRTKYLKQIEAGEWDELPPGVYARGLLRNYALALGLSSARVLRMYVKERPSEARLPEPQLISQPLVRQPRFNLELVAALGLLAVAVGIFSWMVGTQLWPQLQEVARERPGTYLAAMNSDEETPDLPPPTAAATATRDRRPAGTVRPLDTMTPEPTATGMPSLELEVEATSDSWLMVETDGEDAFMGFLRQGESRRWTARETLRLKTGNAGGTQVTLNGQPLPALGGSGDVETRVWRLLPNGDIEQSS